MTIPNIKPYGECRLDQFCRMGAVVGWCWCAWGHWRDVVLKYWPHAAALLPRGLAKSLPVVGYPSGLMSWGRGRSWDRRSRRGLK